MRIIDRYILRQFLQTFAICYISFMGLYVVFDALTKLDQFQSWGEHHGGIWAVMGPFYACKAVWFFDQTAGLLMLISAMFTVTWIQRHNEMTALLAAGISRIRVIAPVIGAVVVVSALAAANRELGIPRLRSQLSIQPKDMASNSGTEAPSCFDNRTNVYFHGELVIAAQQQIVRPDFLLPSSLERYGRKLRAENAYYCPPTQERPGGYLFQGVQEPKGLQHQPSLQLGGERVVLTPKDYPGWLKSSECFLVSDLTFEQFTAPPTWAKMSSLAELIRCLHNPSVNFDADKRVLIHSRVVQPLLDVTLLFLGLPLVLNRKNRNIFLAIGLCAVVTSGFVVLVLTFQTLGAKALLTPARAAWAPLLLSVPVAVALADSMWE